MKRTPAEHKRAYVLRYPDRVAASRKKSRAKHRAKWDAAQKVRRHAARKPRNLVGRRESLRRYYAKNKMKWVALREARLAALAAATPAWANQFFVEEAYSLAALRSRTTGVRWEIDHIVPLVHPLVCGLHVETNLRVILAVENRRKGNRFWPEMPGC